MKEFKKTTQQYVSLDGQNSGCSMGCMGIGCAAVFMLMLMMCGGGFYGLFYSSLPLKAIEAAVEQSGEVEIEGLTGNLTNGFSIDELRFKSEPDAEKWSNLTDIKFKYANNRGWLGSDRLIIEEVSVDGGTIYAQWDPEQNELDLDPNFQDELDEFNKEFEDVRDEIESDGGIGGIREVRVDLVRIANLKIVDPTSGLEITLDEIKFDGFQWLEGKLVSFGQLLVRSNQMELDTFPSIHFADQDSSQRFEGTVYSQMDRRLKEDVSFALDFALVDGQFWFRGSIFGEAIQFNATATENWMEFADFTPADVLKTDGPEILPSKMRFTVDYGSDFNNGPVTVTEEGYFQLGLTRFENLRVNKNTELEESTIAGTAIVNGKEVTAELYLDDRSPYWITVLSSPETESKRELWAQTVFEKSFDQLDEARQSSVTSMLLDRKPAKTSDAAKAKTDDATTDEVIEEVLEDVLKQVESATDLKFDEPEKSKSKSTKDGGDD